MSWNHPLDMGVATQQLMEMGEIGKIGEMGKYFLPHIIGVSGSLRQAPEINMRASIRPDPLDLMGKGSTYILIAAWVYANISSRK